MQTKPARNRGWQQKKGGPMSRPFYFRTVGSLFRGQLRFRRGSENFRIDLLLELGKVLLEHADQRACGLVELRLVLPGVDRVEDLSWHARQRSRDREAEILVGAE